MDQQVALCFVVADAEGEGADGGACVVLLFLTQKGPGEGDGTLRIVSQSFMTNRATVERQLEQHVELRQQHDDEFSALPLLV